MEENYTTLVVQRYLDELAAAHGDIDAELVISALLGRSARRLQLLCNSLLYRGYPRLTRPPLSLEAEDLLGAVVERLLRAMRGTRPDNVRGFFALASQHMRWELNDMARRLDDRAAPSNIQEFDIAAPVSSGSGLKPSARRMLDAINGLREEEREVFELVRLHGMTHSEAAEVLGVSTRTAQRRLNRALHILADSLTDLWPHAMPGGGT